jgi:hypothetical protein
MQDVCLPPIKKSSPKYLRLPNGIFNDINLVLPVAFDNPSIKEPEKCPPK